MLVLVIKCYIKTRREASSV